MPILRATKVLFLRSIREFYDDNGPQTAATIAYYVLFSIFPLLIFVISLAGIVAASESVRQDIVDRVLEAIPLSQGEGRNSVQDAVNGLHGRGGGVVGVHIEGLVRGDMDAGILGVVRAVSFQIDRSRVGTEDALKSPDALGTELIPVADEQCSLEVPGVGDACEQIYGDESLR